MTSRRLVADVGGTNVRFAIADHSGTLDHVKTYQVAGFETFSDALSAYRLEADGLRDANLHRLATQRADPGEGIFFNDLLVAMRRIRNHALNMAEAFLGKK